MIIQVGDGKVLYHLRRVLLSPEGAECPTNRGNYAGGGEGSVNGIHRNSSVNRSGIGSGRVIDQIVIGVEAERNIVGDPEDSVSSPNHGLRVKAVCESDTGSDFGSVFWNCGSGVRIDEENIALQPWETSYASKSSGAGIGQPVGGIRIEVGKAVE